LGEEIITVAGKQNSKISFNVFFYPTTGSNQSRIYISDVVLNNGIADTLIFGGSPGKPHQYFDIRFNSSKKFSITGSNNYNVQTVALHEFSHALGLDHVRYSPLPDSKFLMINKDEFVLEGDKDRSFKLEEVRQLVNKLK